MSRDQPMHKMVKSVLYIPPVYRKGCNIARSDHWMPRHYGPGFKFWFVLHLCGQEHNWPIMRLFTDSKSQDYWMRRNAKYRGGIVQSHGTITWK